MAKKIFAGKIWLIAAVCLIMSLPVKEAFARDGWRRSLPSKHEVIVVGHRRYHYYAGRYYEPGLFNFGFTLVAPPIGAIIRFLPAGCGSIVIGGVRYYRCENTYYQECPSGYVVVQEPVITSRVILPVPKPVPFSAEIVVVNVPNSNGSFTPVRLVKYGNGYIGPQGEFYEGNPTIEQLRVLYGR